MMRRSSSAPTRRNRTVPLALTALLIAHGATDAVAARPGHATPPPNIVFVILDDVGVDQMSLYGNGGIDPASVPNIDALAEQGVTFTNAWAMPECSPSRAAFFTGRLPLRTGVTSAIRPQMLPQAQVSPYEVTLPRVLKRAGYHSAMVGKYHLGSSNPSGQCSPATRGFDFFDGNMEAGPPSLDTGAGSASAEGTYDCGFVRASEQPEGLGSGACYFLKSPCQDGVAGKLCLERGGLLEPGATCQAETPADLDFSRTNAYYVWPETVNEGALPAPDRCSTSGIGCAPIQCSVAPTSEPVNSREYMTTAQTQSGIAWWHAQTGPRMLTVSYNSIHTPYQQPPGVDPATDSLGCTDPNADIREVANVMFESADGEIGRLLEGLGLATLDAGGTIQSLHLDEQNAVLVVVGDNGTFGAIVKPPFDPRRAKGSVNQTGVWVPLIVAGANVEEPGRQVDSLVNAVDLFELFAEVAGLDPREIVPPAHLLDSRSMLPYLENPAQPAIRSYDLTQLASSGTIPTPVDPATRFWPCVLFGSLDTTDPANPVLSGGVCGDLLFDTASFCADNGGLWFGPGPAVDNPDASPPATPDGAWFSCCDVIAALSSSADPTGIAPLQQFAVRDEQYKLNEFVLPNCSKPVDDDQVFPPYEQFVTNEFYDLDVSDVDYPETEICTNLDAVRADDEEACGSPGIPGAPKGNRCANAPACLRLPGLESAYSALQARLRATRASALPCPGDGNQDQRVDQRDLDGVAAFLGSGPSYFDVNADGATDAGDRAIVEANLGSDCLGACRRADLNRDNRVTRADFALLRAASGPCDEAVSAAPGLCAGDLDGDGLVDRRDHDIWRRTRRSTGGAPCPIVVTATGDPSADREAVQSAIDQAVLLDGNGRVVLDGAFDFGDCANCIVVRGPVRIEGTGDPSGARTPDPNGVTSITTSGRAPLVIDDRSNAGGLIRIERLWLRDGLLLAVQLQRVNSALELLHNRITGFRGAAGFRFGIAGAALGPAAGHLHGSVKAVGNFLDSRDEPFDLGDDNGIALQGCNFDSIEIRDNRIHTRGESIEIEDCTLPEGEIRIVGNEVSTDAAVSDLAPLASPSGVAGTGGHPAAVKVAGASARTLSIEDNVVTVNGWATAVCIMPGLVNAESRTVIRGNRCAMSGQFAALLGGWAGNPGFFPPFFLRNALVEDNDFRGEAELGIGFLDWTYRPAASASLVNEASGNVLRGNRMQALRTNQAAVYFGEHTHDNVFVGHPHGAVIDLGTGNVVRGAPKTPGKTPGKK